MGREIKRVPLDFDWPLRQMWRGYAPELNWGEDVNGLYDPPAGDGWQMWENTTEGSPLSPVFASSGELAAWMAEPERGDERMDAAAAAAFVAKPHGRNSAGKSPKAPR